MNIITLQHKSVLGTILKTGSYGNTALILKRPYSDLAEIICIEGCPIFAGVV